MTDSSEFEDRLRSQLSDAEWRKSEVAAQFSGDVVRRIRRRRRLRAVVLMTAGAAGLAISGVALEEIVRQTPALRAALQAALSGNPVYAVCMGIGLAAIAREALYRSTRA